MATRRVKARDAERWTVTPVALPAGRRRAAGAAVDGFLRNIDRERVEVVHAFDATPRRPTRRAVTAAPAPLEIAVSRAPSETLVAMARHPSGAITFHAAQAPPARTRRAAADAVFMIPARGAVRAPTRGTRGLTSAVRVFVLKILAPVATRVMATLAREWESRTWKAAGRAEGWVRVLGDDEGTFKLEPVAPDASELDSGPCLLLLHGTFSDTAGSYRAFARSGFLRAARARYAARIYALEHFTVSRTPRENLGKLLAGLPPGEHAFDVIGFSRGTLLCRYLNERAGDFGPAAARFKLNRAVLIEGPLRGTPLASPARYEELLGWIANLLELFPDHPLTTAAAWLTDGIIWLAHRVTGAMPGLGAMDPDGAELVALRDGAASADPRYFAVGADFAPDAGLRARLLDIAVDGFFAVANDLVVPTEGCFTPGADASSAIPVSQRLVFDSGVAGDGGTGSVHHLNAVGQSLTAQFAASSLIGGAITRGRGERPAAATRAGRLAAEAAVVAAPGAMRLSVPGIAADPTFHILVLSDTDAGPVPRPSRVVAIWNGARVLERFAWSDKQSPGAGQRWRRIIATHQKLLGYFSGDANATLPNEQQLREFGRLLFEALMFGQIGRLYDEARGQVGATRLVVVLTSESGRWAEKPWEFAFDPSRRTWLATDEVHLIRDVLGAIAADILLPHPAPLRILVAYAQPIDADALSVDDERKLILRTFQPLIDLGLAEIDVLARATPAKLQQALEPPSQFDVLHFVGHGEFDESSQRGMLLFEDERHNSQLLSEQQLRRICASRGLRLVFLNACETGRGGFVDFNRGVAPALLAAGIPAVVANQFSVFDTAAVNFAQNLYARLALGRSLSEAMRESRIALNYSLDGTNIDWAVPVLFTRVPSMRLCDVTPATGVTGENVLAELIPGARRGAARRYRIGVWDVSRRFPELDALLQRLNEAQGELEFVAVDVSVPLAAGSVAPTGGRGRDRAATRYLDADIARSRLRRAPFELGVDVIVGFTYHWMISDGTTNVFAVWGDDADGPPNPVALISVAGFDLPNHGPKAEAFIVNGLVGAAAGILCDLNAHEDGEKHCPLYYNERRELALLIGRQRFDPRVRRAIAKRSQPLLGALESALAIVPPDAAKDAASRLSKTSRRAPAPKSPVHGARANRNSNRQRSST